MMWGRMASCRRLLIGVFIPTLFSAQPPLTFDFGSNTKVSDNTIYTAERSYGFDLGSTVTCAEHSCTSDHPFFFSVRVPEGNYNVKLKLGDAAAESVTTVKAESRRLMLEKVTTVRGQFVTQTFTVNIRSVSISTGGEVALGRQADIRVQRYSPIGERARDHQG